MDIIKNLSQDKQSESIAYKTLVEINNLFKLEKDYRDEKLLPKFIELAISGEKCVKYRDYYKKKPELIE